MGFRNSADLHIQSHLFFGWNKTKFIRFREIFVFVRRENRVCQYATGETLWQLSFRNGAQIWQFCVQLTSYRTSYNADSLREIFSISSQVFESNRDATLSHHDSIWTFDPRQKFTYMHFELRPKSVRFTIDFSKPTRIFSNFHRTKTSAHPLSIPLESDNRQVVNVFDKHTRRETVLHERYRRKW